MDYNSDVNAHRVALEINFIAKNAVDREISIDMLKKEIEHTFNGYSPNDKHIIFNRVIKECYQQVWMVEPSGARPSAQFDMRLVCEPASLQQHEKKMKQTFVMQLAQFIVERVRADNHKLDNNNRFHDDFYRECASDLLEKDFARPVDDELLLIYVKQLVIIMRESGLLENEKGIASIRIPGSISEYFKILFNGFWNNCKWEDIFPSAPDAAAEMQGMRAIFIDLLYNSENEVAVEKLANDFFEMTGFAAINDAFLISFLDFYLVTWLNHFGLVSYRFSGVHDPVSIAMSKLGRWFLQGMHTE
ncbi:MAG: hypothetical protein ACOCWZ_06350 [Spirochaetota bacterium]